VVRFSIAPGVCGQGEGYALPGDLAATAAILARLGAKVDYIDMDEPIFFGSYDTDPSKCQLSIPDLVTRTVMNMKDFLAVYPDARIVDIEPAPGLMQSPTWKQDTTAFHLGLMQQLRSPVYSMQLDVAWDSPAALQAIQDMHQYVHENGMGLALILNGTAIDTSDAGWINHAIRNFEAVEGGLHIIPDQVLFTTWNAFPTYNMPETSPTTQTWLINRYFRPLSELEVHFVGQGARGKLRELNGKPIANATVNGFVPGANLAVPLPTMTTSGVVPPGAVYADIGVRVNTECGIGCNGLNDLLLGVSQYQETQGGTSQFSFSTVNDPGYLVGGTIVSTEVAGGTEVTRIIATAGQIAMWNSPVFPVTVGATYNLTMAAATIGGLGWNGTINLIWLDQNQHEVSRVPVTPAPGKARVSTAVTAADGTFALFPMPRSVDGPNPVTVEFDGGGTYRSTVFTPVP